MSARTRPAGGVTATDYLTSVMLCLKRPEHGHLVVEFKPFRGWVLQGDIRSLADDGSDFMGRNWLEAEKGIRWFLA